MTITTIIYILGVLILPPLIYISITSYRSRYKYARQFAEEINGLTKYKGKVMKYEDGILFVMFRIEEEKKTVIQRCSVVRKFHKDEDIDIYFYENGFDVRAMPASGNIYEKEFIKLTVISLLTAWAAISDILLMIIGAVV